MLMLVADQNSAFQVHAGFSGRLVANEYNITTSDKNIYQKVKRKVVPVIN
jgi:hypothetical protein